MPDFKIAYYLVATSRPTTGLLAFFLCAFIISHKGHISIYNALIESAPLALLTMTGFVVNDVYDFKKDKAAGKRRPVACGLITAKCAIFFAVLLSASTIAISILVNSLTSFLVVFVALSLVISYTPLARMLPVLKALFVAILSCTPLVLAATIADIALTPIYYFIIISYITGREFILDVRDSQTDVAYGLKGIVYYLNSRFVFWLGICLMTIGLYSLATQAKSPFCITICCVAYIFALFSAYAYVQQKKLATAYSQISIFLACVSIAITS